MFLQGPEPGITAERDGLLFGLEADSSGRVVRASVTMTVPPEKAAAFRSTIGPGVEERGTKATISIGGDPKLFEELVGHLQVLESNLAFGFIGGALKRIDWRACQHDFVAETAEEREIGSIRISQR